MDCDFFKRAGKPDLAYRYSPASGTGKSLPPLMFLGGFKSDMSGTKASFFEDQCRARGQGYLRFDYSGHGRSGGKFEDGCISDWHQDAADMLGYIGLHRPILAGSSMGGWIALLMALQNPSNFHGVLGIAAAPDFTDMIWDEKLNADQKREMEQNGFITEPSRYSDQPYIYTHRLITDGRKNRVLDRVHEKASFALRIVQGVCDPDVPWEIVNRIEAALPHADVEIILIDDGDHSLSRPQDLEILNHEILALSVMRDTVNLI
jgi:pimeloyl-ACP methyl ester carboxylesterase